MEQTCLPPEEWNQVVEDGKEFWRWQAKARAPLGLSRSSSSTRPIWRRPAIRIFDQDREERFTASPHLPWSSRPRCSRFLGLRGQLLLPIAPDKGSNCTPTVGR